MRRSEASLPLRFLLKVIHADGGRMGRDVSTVCGGVAWHREVVPASGGHGRPGWDGDADGPTLAPFREADVDSAPPTRDRRPYDQPRREPLGVIVVVGVRATPPQSPRARSPRQRADAARVSGPGSKTQDRRAPHHPGVRFPVKAFKGRGIRRPASALRSSARADGHAKVMIIRAPGFDHRLSALSMEATLANRHPRLARRWLGRERFTASRGDGVSGNAAGRGLQVMFRHHGLMIVLVSTP